MCSDKRKENEESTVRLFVLTQVADGLKGTCLVGKSVSIEPLWTT